MVLFGKAKKAKVPKGKAVKTSKTKTTTKKLKAGQSTAGKTKKQGLLSKIGSYQSKTISGLSNAYLGSDITDFGGKKGGKGGFGKHRKGKIPKSVRKWAKRITTRRKQEEKLIKALFGAEGGKILKKRVIKSSPGYITAEERFKALQR